MNKVALLMSLGFGVFATACGIGTACTMMGCSGLLEIRLSEASLGGAEYILDMDRDGESESCSFELPFDKSTASCTLGSEITLEGENITVRVMTGMGGNFETLSVHLSEYDLNLLSEEITVDWSDPVFPNGEECDQGSGCFSAEIDLEVE